MKVKLLTDEDQPAQEGGRLDPHTLERAAQVADKRARIGTSTERNVARGIRDAIRNLRGDT